MPLIVSLIIPLALLLSTVQQSSQNSVRQPPPPPQQPQDANYLMQRPKNLPPLTPILFETTDGQQVPQRPIVGASGRIIQLKCASVKEAKVEGRAEELSDKINTVAQEQAALLG